MILIFKSLVQDVSHLPTNLSSSNSLAACEKEGPHAPSDTSVHWSQRTLELRTVQPCHTGSTSEAPRMLSPRTSYLAAHAGRMIFAFACSPPSSPQVVLVSPMAVFLTALLGLSLLLLSSPPQPALAVRVSRRTLLVEDELRKPLITGEHQEGPLVNLCSGRWQRMKRVGRSNDCSDCCNSHMECGIIRLGEAEGLALCPACRQTSNT